MSTILTKFQGAESSIYFPNSYKGEKIVYKKYNDFFMVSILANNPKKEDTKERIVRLTKEQFIEESKHPRLSSVVKSRKQQMELRNNFLTLPNVSAGEDGSITIECFTRDTQYTNLESIAATRAFAVLIENGKDAMGFMKLLELTASNKERRSNQEGYVYVQFQIHASYIGACFGAKETLGSKQRAKFNKLMDLLEENYPEFGIERETVRPGGNSNLKPAKCIVGKYTRLQSETAKKVMSAKETTAPSVEANTLESDDKEVKEVVETISVEVIIDEYIQDAALVDENEGQHTADEVEAGIDMANAYFEEAPQPVIENVSTSKITVIDMNEEASGTHFTSSVENVVVGMRRHNEKLMVPKYNSISSKKKNYTLD